MRRLAEFPAVTARSRAEGRSYQDLWARWRGLQGTPMRVIARLAGPHIPTVAGGLHLDGLLSAAVMSSHLVGARCDNRPGVAIPLPLHLAGVSAEGWPLWAATDLRSVAGAEAEIYIHKRHPVDRAPLATQIAANTSAGRYKDVRMPLRVQCATEVEAWCLGDLDTVAALLRGVDYIGRKGAIGQGRVLSWSVEPADEPGGGARDWLDWILQRRPVPIAMLGAADVRADRVAPLDSWTPPYWDAARHAACRRPRWTT